MPKAWPKLFSRIRLTRFVVCLFAAIFLAVSFPFTTEASESQPHYTIFISQVRGNICCDPGNLAFLQAQVQALQSENLHGTFAVRYDALIDPSYLSALQKAIAQGDELAGFLEITPDLAAKSGVVFHDSSDKWFEAGNAYLLGYSQEERKKLIDTYMSAFSKAFGTVPKTTVAWMIDSFSLQYLYDSYHIVAHEITREQWDTDSATIIGGPEHYPYLPSRNWAIIPADTPAEKMPIIIRQTIDDPVENYGDFTSSHTSQPNDFLKRTQDYSYFEYLFRQSHNQKLNPYSIAVLGLENSMDQKFQDTFLRQIKTVSDWVKSSPDNMVITAAQFASFSPVSPTTVYEGIQQNQPSSRAWWINTPAYRVRLRLDNGSLYISDLRIYNRLFTDPYYNQTASAAAYWVTPFVVDGSRFLLSETTYDSTLSDLPDNLAQRDPKWKLPTRIELQTGIKPVDAQKYNLARQNDDLTLSDQNGNPVAKFNNSAIEIPNNSRLLLDNLFSAQAINSVGLNIEKGADFLTLTFWSDPAKLDQARNSQPPLLLPALSEKNLDPQKSYVYVNNRYTIFDRNPIRLVFYPKDSLGYPDAISSPVSVTTNPKVKNIKIGEPNRLNGAVFIDLFTDKPGEINVEILSGTAKDSETVYSSPNCKAAFLSCLTHPWYFWWYLQTIK